MLIVMNALDSTAKSYLDRTAEPYKERFHNMLFSRILEQYQKLISGQVLSLERRFQSLFGPINYCWLEDNDLTFFDKQIGIIGLRNAPGFNTLMESTFFLCWPLLKDLITPEIKDASTFFTPMKEEYAVDLARFLYVIAMVVEKIKAPSRIVVDAQIDYFTKDNRPPLLNRIRNSLANANLDLLPSGDNTFQLQSMSFQIFPFENGHKIIVRQTSYSG